MKNIFSILILLFLTNYSFGQDITTMIKLFDISNTIGITNRISIDTVWLKSSVENINRKVAEKQLNLLKAAEYYSVKDYENSSYYIKKAALKFKISDYNTLKYIVLIGSYANLKDIKNTAKYFYIVNKTKLIDPENMRIIRGEIRNNFKKINFDEALSDYYYYHERLKIIDEIKFNCCL